MESYSTSVSMNIAEGKARYSNKEFIQFLYIARGSLYETITLLMLFHKRNWIDGAQFDTLKSYDDEIGKVISGLIRSIITSKSYKL